MGSRIESTAEHMNVRVQAHLNAIAQIANRVVKSSGSNEILMRAAKQFAAHDMHISNTQATIGSMENVTKMIDSEGDAIKEYAQPITLLQKSAKHAASLDPGYISFASLPGAEPPSRPESPHNVAE
eukprot:m.50553 g.50553  ORF g.50553 m.50553 type:complete len:126 (-) comp10678_c0_seq4:395-772(-)